MERGQNDGARSDGVVVGTGSGAASAPRRALCADLGFMWQARRAWRGETKRLQPSHEPEVDLAAADPVRVVGAAALAAADDELEVPANKRRRMVRGDAALATVRCHVTPLRRAAAAYLAQTALPVSVFPVSPSPTTWMLRPSIFAVSTTLPSSLLAAVNFAVWVGE